VKVPDGKDPKAEQAMLANAAGQPIADKTTFATGADVSRFQRRTVPGKPAAPFADKLGGVASAIGPIVRVARGSTVTPVALGDPNKVVDALGNSGGKN
jgi:pilus assembly protein CpaB